jgi:hypothetical protein
MSTELTTPAALAAPRRPWLVGLIALVVFGALATAAAYYGVQNPAAAVPSAKEKGDASIGAVTRIVLPADDTPIPDGPHRDDFRVACTVCHSARLVFTQPQLTEKQWTAVVHKMTAKYGAPLSADEEKRMVRYLHTVHGK